MIALSMGASCPLCWGMMMGDPKIAIIGSGAIGLADVLAQEGVSETVLITDDGAHIEIGTTFINPAAKDYTYPWVGKFASQSKNPHMDYLRGHVEKRRRH